MIGNNDVVLNVLAEKIVFPDNCYFPNDLYCC